MGGAEADDVAQERETADANGFDEQEERQLDERRSREQLARLIGEARTRAEYRSAQRSLELAKETLDERREKLKDIVDFLRSSVAEIGAFAEIRRITTLSLANSTAIDTQEKEATFLAISLLCLRTVRIVHDPYFAPNDRVGTQGGRGAMDDEVRRQFAVVDDADEGGSVGREEH
ncbi:unnamed protein product [Sphagnum balticum]